MWPNPQFPADLVTFTKEILKGKLHFLCSVLKESFLILSFVFQFSVLHDDSSQDLVSDFSNPRFILVKFVFYPISGQCYHFMPPNLGFLVFSWDIKWEHWPEMGSLREKCLYLELFWSVFSLNAGKYGPE